MSTRVSRQERSEQLLDVTQALIAARGYRALSMESIADAAGVSKPIVYRIYPGLQALLLALFRREQRRAEEALEQIIPRDPGESHPVDLLVGSLSGILDAVSRHPLTWRLVLFPPDGTPAPVRVLVERRRAGLLRRARRLVRWGVPYLATDEQLDEDVLARVLVSWAQEYARILLEDPGADREQLVTSARALFEGLAWRRGPGE